MTDLKLPPPGLWSFDAPGVAENFDAHVRRQLPWYDDVHAMVAEVVAAYLPRGGRLVDVGASTGALVGGLKTILEDRSATAVCVEPSEAMRARLRERVAGFGCDVRILAERAETTAAWDQRADVVVAFLSLMFVPVAERRALLDRIFAALRPGGVFVVVDRDDLPAGEVGRVLQRMTWRAKVDSGESYDDVARKELSLAGVQRPLSVAVVAAAAGAAGATCVPFFLRGPFYGAACEVPV